MNRIILIGNGFDLAKKTTRTNATGRMEIVLY